MSWLDKVKSTAASLSKKISKPEEQPWIECKKCKEMLYPDEAQENQYVCPKCDYHFRVSPHQRIAHLLEPGSFVEHDHNLASVDPLKFKDKKRYRDRIRGEIGKSESPEAIVCGSGRLGSHALELCAFDFKYMGGSMGSVVGEKITRGIERALKNKTPLIIISCSGGARMQEGILSLMQMGKTASALHKLAAQKLPYISILTDPTTGGVSASFAMLGDFIIAEPGATIGFAGRRVIEQTIKQKLPEGFQTAEFLLDHGLIDRVIHRHKLKEELNTLLSLTLNRTIDRQESAAT